MTGDRVVVEHREGVALIRLADPRPLDPEVRAALSAAIAERGLARALTRGGRA